MNYFVPLMTICVFVFFIIFLIKIIPIAISVFREGKEIKKLIKEQQLQKS